MTDAIFQKWENLEPAYYQAAMGSTNGPTS